MKKFFLTGLFAALLVVCFAQKPYTVVFYNLENLFDTINDPETKDEEFLPDGARRWNTAKYNKKLSNMERVLFDIAAIQKEFPAVIGVSEIENRTVLEDLIAQPKLSKGNYRIVHYDSPDARGVDCAFFYRPDQFKLEGSAAIPFVMPGQPNFRTRDFVTMWGTIEGEPFFFLVSHWPSRLGGKDASAPKRMAAAEQCRHIA
ncbi:MAG: endonuclease/exonuclease/phosphatase family protein, partial [Alistipes sp.]|nr:endonuclease/exonuclease/phosphatase family protein [Alistipes sp.]